MSANKFHVKIAHIDYGRYLVNKDDTLCVCVGSRKGFMNNKFLFNVSDKRIKKVWSFDYTDPRKSSFVVALFKSKMFGKDEEIGQIELKINGFKPNVVTTYTFPINATSTDPPRVTIVVHRSEDGCDPFDAPDDDTVSTDVIVTSRAGW